MVSEGKQSPYEWAKNREGYPVLLRTKYPRFAIEVQDGFGLTNEQMLSYFGERPELPNEFVK